MCAINGFTYSDPDLIREMNRLTRHRGPDQTDQFVGENISLGHNRLAIIDLSERGKQPMWDAAGEIAIVFNGEIYNFQELKKDLEKTYQFQSNSDTEVLLYAYKAYGRDCLRKLDGIFAFAIWDTRKKELFLARDRIGVNPLYYYHRGDQFIFSSEMKAILAHDIERRVDREAFNLYMQLLYVPEPHTMIVGIKKLPPASWLLFRHGKTVQGTYWSATDRNNFSSRSEATERIRTLFRASVKRQLISDRPVGIFLSGGIDSTAVLGAASAYHAGPIDTFSVGFKDSLNPDKFNADARLAKQTAKYYGARHRELMIGPEDIQRHLEAITWHMDEPNANPTAGAMFLLSEMAKKHVAVVLGGDGGDELFGGYPRYYYSRLISLYQRLPDAFGGAGRYMLRLLGRADAAEKLGLPPGADRIAAFLAQKTQTTSRIVQSEIFEPTAAVSYLSGHFFADEYNTYADDFEKYFMSVDRRSWLPDESLLRTNKMTMAFGLEARVPILDHVLAELAMSIPTAWKFSMLQRPDQFQGKNIWKDAVSEYIPQHILDEQKRGWFTPMSKWLRGGLRDRVSEILSEENFQSDFFDSTGVRQMWQDHLSGKGYYLAPIWAIVAWQLWYNAYIRK